MASWWKIGFCILVAFGAGTTGTSAQVLTTDDLVRAGVTRLSDILELADDWVGSSTEGYHWTIAPLGLSWEASPDWSLFLDGQPVNIQALNQRSLNALPLTIAEICEVQFHANPVVINGHLAHGGAVEINRCTPPTGVSIKGQFAAGNETGDPGPYRYTDSETPNVDRTGPVAHSTVTTASDTWFIRVTGGLDEHHATNPRIRPRVLQLYQGEKDARILYRMLNLDTKLRNHRINVGASQIDDLMFLPVMGREIPLDKTITFVSASLSRKSFGYSLSGNAIELTTRKNPDSVSVNFSQRKIHAHAYAVSSLPGTFHFEYGGTATLSRTGLGATRSRDQLGTFRAYAVLQPDLLFDTQVKTLAAFAVDAGVLGYELFSHTWHERSGIGLRFMIRHRAPDSKMNFAGWVRRGYRIEDAEIHFQPQGLPKRELIYSGDLSWTTGNSVKLHVSGGWQRYVNFVRPLTESTLDSTRIRLQTMTGIVSTSGHIARTSLRIFFPLSEKLILRVYGIYAYPWSTLHTFRDAWHHRLQVGMRGEFQPNDRFSLDVRVRYIGATVWNEFEEAARKNPEFYTMNLPGTAHLHLTIQKRFWENRLRVSATMRNVLDHPHITHPAGARTRALFQVSLHYAFQMRSTDSQ